ncbi:MAG: DUF563 domain-containing protein, partial [Candidatus Eremiobacteraeota bacterium]|nr:DUF563 domain-containing protein [Candidatus Eremiobacteraeota bacterium]
MNGFPEARSLCPAPAARTIHNLLPFERALVEQFGLSEGFRVYCSMLGLPRSARLIRSRLEPLQKFAQQSASAFAAIYPSGEPYSIAPPRIVGTNDARVMNGTARAFYVTCLTDATAHPHSALVRANGILLADFEGDELRRFDDFIQLDPYVFHAEGEDVWVIESSALIGSESPYHSTGPTADLIAHGNDSFEVEEGFGALLGPRSPHFGHWLWEYLPKYLVAVACGALPRVPILMNPAMPPQLWESLRLLIPRGVDVIELPFAPTHVRRLWYAPALMHEPFFENVNERYAGPDHRCFPPERFKPALEAMAEAAASVSAPTIKN